METLYQCTIFASLTLLAIVIAIFVFAASIYRAVLELHTAEEKDALNRRKELISRQKKEVVAKIEHFDDSAFVQELRGELDKLNTELDTIDKSVLKFRCRVEALTVRRMVIIPASFLLISIIASGIAIVTSGILPTIMWTVSLASIGSGFYFTYNNLSTVEFFSRFIDLSTLMEHALERHAQKQRPEVDLDLKDYDLVIEHGQTGEIHPFVFLKKGLTAKNVRIRFVSTEELDFPEEKVCALDVSKTNMREPKLFSKEIGNLNYGVHREVPIKVKAPDATGQYTMSHWIQCDDFTSQEQNFIVRVI